MSAVTWRSVGLLLACLALRADALAADEPVYFRQGIAGLQITEGSLEAPKGDASSKRSLGWRSGGSVAPRVVLDGPGEAYCTGAMIGGRSDFTGPADRWGIVCVRMPKAGADVTGQLTIVDRDSDWVLRKVRFKIPADQAKADFRQAFFHAKADHYEGLLDMQSPGAAWFRHQFRSARAELGLSPDKFERPNRGNARTDLSRFDDTYSLFSGGRAVSENLQLDRAFVAMQSDKRDVPIQKISGITVAEIDWTKLIAGKQPQLDPLAQYVPADQHAVFFPTFAALLRLVDEAELQGTRLLQAAEPRAEDFGIAQRYQRQLGLRTTALGRMLGPQVIASVALTGGDPYFRVGTDVAILFEAKDVAALQTLLAGQITLNTATEKSLKRSSGEVLGIDYQAWQSPGRRVSSYLATIGQTAVVTNSLEQLKRLAETKQGQQKPIASLDEYKFFRNRYRRGEASETALLFLSDATIRRWCGPRWRIADSRRTRDLAALAEAQAAAVPQLATGKVKPGPVAGEYQLSGGEAIKITPQGVLSAAGTIEFLTPIRELPMTMVSKSEADGYERWRDGYQSNFRWAFDPIALRLTVAGDRLAADLTVMPLIAESEYKTLIELSQGAALSPESGDPHDTIAHIVMALNRDSDQMKQWGGMGALFAPQLNVNPLSWLGTSVSLYVEDSPIWKELAKLTTDVERAHYLEQRGWSAPVAVNIAIASTLKTVAFLTALRAFIEQTAPDMVRWENVKHGEQSYVKVSPTERGAQGGVDAKLAVYYALTSDGLTISTSEKLIQGVLDRAQARFEARKGGKPAEGNSAKSAPPPSSPWLGENLALAAGPLALQAVAGLWGADYQNAMQRLAWGNLPILNEWKRRFPKQDPVELHERLWGVRLICPGGGEYVWNERWQTMESTVYGHPGEPKAGPIAPPMLGLIEHLGLGLTFEKQGLRARAELMRKKP